MGRYDSLSSRLDDIKWEIDSASDDASELQKEIEELENKIEELENKIEELDGGSKTLPSSNLRDQLKMELLNEIFQMYELEELEKIFGVEYGKPLVKLK